MRFRGFESMKHTFRKMGHGMDVKKEAYHPLPNGGIFQVFLGRFSLAAVNLNTMRCSPPSCKLESTTNEAPFLKVMTFCSSFALVSITCEEQNIGIHPTINAFW